MINEEEKLINTIYGNGNTELEKVLKEYENYSNKTPSPTVYQHAANKGITTTLIIDGKEFNVLSPAVLAHMDTEFKRLNIDISVLENALLNANNKISQLSQQIKKLDEKINRLNQPSGMGHGNNL